MNLQQEILSILENAQLPMSIEDITRFSKITEHESRVGNICRELVDKEILTTCELQFSVKYRLKNKAQKPAGYKLTDDYKFLIKDFFKHGPQAMYDDHALGRLKHKFKIYGQQLRNKRCHMIRVLEIKGIISKKKLPNPKSREPRYAYVLKEEYQDIDVLTDLEMI